MAQYPAFKAAAVHAAPVFLDAAATVEKAVALIAEAARHGAELVVFPESYVPGFPIWAALWAPIYNHDLFARFAASSMLVPGQETQRLCEAARHHGVFVSIGVSERSASSLGGLWNSNLFIGDDGSLLNHHRKLVPTFYEKLVWAPGDGAGLQVSDTRIGRIGALICGENTNPLARFALMAQGEQVHISSWPPVWPTRKPTAGGNYNNVAANRIRASAHSFEAKAFGIVCAGALDKATRDFLVGRDPDVAEILDNTLCAESYFVDPTGEPFGDIARNAETIVYGDIDISRCVEPKQFHDVVGYYNRFDVFNLTVNRRRLVPAEFRDDVAPGIEPVGQAPDLRPSGPALSKAAE